MSGLNRNEKLGEVSWRPLNEKLGPVSLRSLEFRVGGRVRRATGPV